MVIGMSINFPNASRAYDATRNAVHFWGYDRTLEASFYVSADALQRLAPGAMHDEPALLAAFDRHLSKIRAAAARRYGSSGKGGSYDLHPSDF
ncbi:MAG: DUF1488 domain-containing protein [Pseudolabrys sp.]|nr:DUF1488 domain-containing protein [Pseudolabrys sp.]